MTAIERQLPHDIEAEQAVLGCMFIDPDAPLQIASILEPESFFRLAHRRIYEATQVLVDGDQPVDILTISAELRRRGELEDVGGEGALIGLLNAVPNALHAAHYAGVVRDRWERRKLIRAASAIATLAYSTEQQTDELKAAAERELFSATASTGKRTDTRPIRQIVREYIDRTEARSEMGDKVFGVRTGFADLDRILGGLQKSDLVLLAGRPSMGKTALALGMGVNAALKHGARVALFSLEMSEGRLVERMIASESHINSQDLRQGALQENEWPSFYEAAGRLSENRMWINDRPDITPVRLRAECRRLYVEHGLDLIMIDYIGLMSGDRRSTNLNNEISEISRGLKKLARELDVPVLALAQLNRSVEQRENKRPRLSDLRDSGSLEQDADVVLFIYRDEYYNPETTETPNIAEIEIAKHRNGPTGRVELYWHGQLAAFRNLHKEEIDLGVAGVYGANGRK